MIRSFVTLLLLLLSTQVGWAQAQAPQKRVYATGRVEPKNLAELRARSVRNHSEMLKALPKATAATWDCRTLGQVPPIVDQGQCFPAGTLVRLAGGKDKRIEDVVIGDRVVTAHNREATVFAAMYRHIDEPLYSLSTDKRERLQATGDHLILTRDGWVKLKDLRVGDSVMFYHQWRVVDDVSVRSIHSGPIYNLQVDGDHSYLANGIAVHNCGSCWDFSGTSICNSALIIAGYGKADGSFTLSEQYTLDCGQNGGCDGDDNTTVTTWAKATGLPTTQQYGPYQGAAGSCKLTPAMTLYKIQDWGFCTTTNTSGVANTQDIKTAMAKFGPIGSGIAADDAFMNNPPGTVFKGSGSTSINHDIVLVGWDDSKGAWILRNSWGTSWCDGGYCYISYGANGVGTEAIWATAQPLPQIPAITSALTLSGSIATPLTYQVTASNTPTSFGATGLPPGFNISTTTGSITGTPITSGSYQVTLSAANSIGTGTATLTMSIAGPGPGPGPAGAPVITSPLSTSVVVNTPLSYQITATNNPLLLGASGLPSGLSCSISGLITGTPTSTGSFPIVLLAGNASGMGTSTMTLVVSTVMNPVTLILTPDQVQAVITASGVVTINNKMTMSELRDALGKCLLPPGPGSGTSSPASQQKLEDEVRDLKRAVDAMMKLLLPPDKTQEPPLLMPPAIDSKLTLRATNVYARQGADVWYVGRLAGSQKAGDIQIPTRCPQDGRLSA